MIEIATVAGAPGAANNLERIVEQVSTIVCDWNGTIVDDADRALVATNRTLAEFGLPAMTSRRFRESFTLPLATFFKTLGVPEQSLVRAGQRWNGHLARGTARLSPGVGELLAISRQSGIPVGVVSAADEAVVRADALALGISDGLSFIIGGAADKSSVLREIVFAHEPLVLYIGDTEYDMAEAAKAGAIGIAYGAGYQSRATLLNGNAFALIDEFSVLASALERAR